MHVVEPNTVLPRFPDDRLLTLGTDKDGVIVLRSATLTANTALANVLIGTPVTPALAANSVVISNITSNGDILIAANDGGHSKAGIWIDGSLPGTYIYNGYLATNLDANTKNITNLHYLDFDNGGYYVKNKATTDGHYYALAAHDGTVDREIVRCENDAGAALLKLASGANAKVGFFGAAPVAQQAHIADPTGGGVVDAECRAVVATLLSYLDADAGFGLLAGA